MPPPHCQALRVAVRDLRPGVLWTSKIESFFTNFSKYPGNNGIFSISTGAGFLPSTVIVYYFIVAYSGVEFEGSLGEQFHISLKCCLQ